MYKPVLFLMSFKCFVIFDAPSELYQEALNNLIQFRLILSSAVLSRYRAGTIEKHLQLKYRS